MMLVEKVFLTRDVIDAAPTAASFRRFDSGAIVSFFGTVRAEARCAKRLLALHYDAYEEMALEQMGAVRQQAIDKMKVLDAMIVHRLGRIPLGEASIFVAVLSGHRAEAFEACRWIVDQVKTDVPIWKKDIWSDGSEAWTLVTPSS